MTKTFLLILYLLNSGIYTERHITSENCKDALIEAELVKSYEMWTGLCVDPDDEVYVQIGGMQ